MADDYNLRSGEEFYNTPKMTVTYHAKNGMTFTIDAVWYEIQEALNELSRQAYENDTEVNFVVIS